MNRTAPACTHLCQTVCKDFEACWVIFAIYIGCLITSAAIIGITYVCAHLRYSLMCSDITDDAGLGPRPPNDDVGLGFSTSRGPPNDDLAGGAGGGVRYPVPKPRLDGNDLGADNIDMAHAADMFVGGIKDDKITNIIDHTRVLFSTYGYAGTGISILKMTAELYLTPRKASMKQIVGRILRRGSDPAIPRIIVDIVDKKTSLRYQLGARRVAREHYGFKETDIMIKYTEIPL